ncbi:MAG: hypothetical protein ABIH23_09065 [bacterium]
MKKTKDKRDNPQCTLTGPGGAVLWSGTTDDLKTAAKKLREKDLAALKAARESRP